MPTALDPATARLQAELRILSKNWLRLNLKQSTIKAKLVKVAQQLLAATADATCHRLFQRLPYEIQVFCLESALQNDSRAPEILWQVLEPYVCQQQTVSDQLAARLYAVRADVLASYFSHWEAADKRLVFKGAHLTSQQISTLIANLSQALKEQVQILLIQQCDQLMDLMPFQSFKNLQALHIQGCRDLVSLQGIEQCSSLKSLTIEEGWSLASWQGCEALLQLQELSCSSCVMVSDWQVLQALPLQILNIVNCHTCTDRMLMQLLQDSKLAQTVQRLNLAKTLIAQLPPLLSLPKLIELNIRNTLITSLAPLAESATHAKLKLAVTVQQGHTLKLPPAWLTLEPEFATPQDTSFKISSLQSSRRDGEGKCYIR